MDNGNIAFSVVLEISQLVEGVAIAPPPIGLADPIGGPTPPPGGLPPNDRIIEETEGRCITLLLEGALLAERGSAKGPAFPMGTGAGPGAAKEGGARGVDTLGCGAAG